MANAKKRREEIFREKCVHNHYEIRQNESENTKPGYKIELSKNYVIIAFIVIIDNNNNYYY